MTTPSSPESHASRPQVPLDPGLSQTYYGDIRRIINKDGTFNVRRSQTGTRLHTLHIYQYLIGLSWSRFMLIVVAGYFVVNTFYALVYLLIGIGHLTGADGASGISSFFSAFFFSAETFTTVGYGNIAPQGFLTNLVASLEAASGLMAFALAAALFYGRFSRPHAKLVYSEWAIVAPYQGRTGLEFRIVNSRRNLLMELQARVLLMTVEKADSGLKRVYRLLDLERPSVEFLPLTWTIVHPIDETSPLRGATPETLAALKAEILILIRGFDDTFNQWVHSRYSYRYDEIVWGARFLPAFRVDARGDTIVDIDLVSRVEAAILPTEENMQASDGKVGNEEEDGRVEIDKRK
ncbi:MAG TPA: ion channel [bacterium]|jgi:inward rectifier potassium channel